MAGELKKLQKARIRLILKNPFWGALALNLKLEISEKVPTAAVDGKVIMFNPEFMKGLDENQLHLILLHETTHAALGHCLLENKQERDPTVLNMAQDFAIHSLFQCCSPAIEVPRGGLYNFKYDRWSVDQIYQDLITEGAKAPKTFIKDVIMSEDPVLKETWKEAVASALASGSVPDAMERVFKDLLAPPKVDWVTLLRQYFQTRNGGDYNWIRPNRKFLPYDMYLPSLKTEILPCVSIIIDTSGSIDEEELQEFQTELKDIFLTCAPERVQIIYCDSKVQAEKDFLLVEESEWKFEPVGGGGTDMTPALKKANGNPILIFTDMCMSPPEFEPEGSVLWLSTSEEKTDLGFGEVVCLKG